MRLARNDHAWRSAALMACAVASLLGCEQSADVVVVHTSTPLDPILELDAGALFDAGALPDAAPMEQPPNEQPPNEQPTTNDQQRCVDLAGVYFKLERVFYSDPPCSFPRDDEATGQLLWDHVLRHPPAVLKAEDDPASYWTCNAVRWLPIESLPWALPIDDEWWLCGGYCKALGFWLEETKPIVTGCIEDVGSP